MNKKESRLRKEVARLRAELEQTKQMLLNGITTTGVQFEQNSEGQVIIKIIVNTKKDK